MGTIFSADIQKFVDKAKGNIDIIVRKVSLDLFRKVIIKSPVDTGRFSELTIPVVTVPSRPSGEPTATTFWPTRRSADRPTAIGVRPDTP